MTKWWVAQDNFVSETAEGAPLSVTKGQTRPDGHPLVVLDRSEAERAAKAGIERTALFAPQDFDDEEPAPKAKPAAKAAKGSA